MTPAPIACVRLAELPIAAHHGERRDVQALRAVHRGRGSAARVLWCDSRAADAGVAPGITLAAARARAADLISVPVDPARLALAHRRVVERLLHVSPRIAAAGPARFWVEPACPGVTLEGWCQDADAILTGLGPVAIGVGPGATVAWAAARSIALGHRIVSPAEARAFLDEAPVEVLDITGEARDILLSLGIRRVRDLRALDPVSLGMRFGPEVAEARRRADGFDPRGPATPRPERPDEVVVSLDDPASAVEPLTFLLGPATERLAAELRRRGHGVTRLCLTLHLDRGLERRLETSTAAPIGDGRALLELLRTRLALLELPAPVIAMRLTAEATSELREPPPSLLGEPPGRDEGAREVALGRLRARLGEAAVRRADRVEVGAPLGRARWSTGLPPARGEALPWCRLDPPRPVRGGAVELDGRRRRVLRIGRVERAADPWWEDGRLRVRLTAWAEVEGPVLVLLRATCSTDCDDRWEAVAWVD